MVNAALMSQAKPGLFLINISHGALVDQEALLKALDNGTIGYLALNVTTPEPLPNGHPLYSYPKALISPHIFWIGGERGPPPRQP
jgi:phosphoglycerate dehydrogenase-like enzyme